MSRQRYYLHISASITYTNFQNYCEKLAASWPLQIVEQFRDFLDAPSGRVEAVTLKGLLNLMFQFV